MFTISLANYTQFISAGKNVTNSTIFSTHFSGQNICIKCIGKQLKAAKFQAINLNCISNIFFDRYELKINKYVYTINSYCLLEYSNDFS